RFAHANTTPVRRLKEPAGFWTNNTTVEASRPAAADDPVLHVPAAIRGTYNNADDAVKVGAGATAEVRRITVLRRVPLKSPLARDYPQTTLIEFVTETPVAGPARKLSRSANSGTTAIALDKRSGLNEGDVL